MLKDYLLLQASSQSRPSISQRILCNSGIARVGCVSLSWIATCWGNSFHGRFVFLNRRTISWSDAAHQKYCCFNRSSLPRSMLIETLVYPLDGLSKTHLSFGYKTAEIVSALCWSATELSYSPELNFWKSNSPLAALLAHNLRLFVVPHS